MRAVNKSPRDARLEKPLRQPAQFPQPRRVEHRDRAVAPAAAKHVRCIGADRARRAIRQINHEQQHTVPTLK